VLLAALTLTWGLNWPVMKVGVTGFPPLTFRSISMWLGLPVLFAVTALRKVPLRIERKDWREVGLLTITNMLVWHVFAILAVQALSSGRAAILGYTMPIWSALWGLQLYGQRLRPRQIGGIAAAGVGVFLLLWHELAHFAGRPLAALGMLFAAAIWALGTQQLRHTRIVAPTLAIVFWMTLITTLAMTLLAIVLEHGIWIAPPPQTWAAIGYNAVLIFGFAQAIWLVLARGLPPVASTMSVMLIPVLGTLSGAWWLGERLHWQDGAAIVLMLVAIAAVMWPARAAAQRA
jgi:drug/metabolite transporter (DMT)-like permease